MQSGTKIDRALKFRDALISIDCDICAEYAMNSLKKYVNFVISWVMDYIVGIGNDLQPGNDQTCKEK